MSEQFSEAFVAVMEYMEAKHGPFAATASEGCFEAAIDGDWTIAVNGQREPEFCSYAFLVPAFHCAVFWHGHMAGILGPFGGEIVAHENANEDLFIEAVRSAA
jgi:hypothetical protein